jgi:peptide/nickel transport system substrate-binding protein
LLQRLDVTETPILPQHIYASIADPTKTDANLKPVGTGPFMFDSYTPGVEVRLKRNPHYFKAGQPLADEVVFRVIPDAETQIQALQKGDVDYVWSVPGPDVSKIAAGPDTAVLPAFSGPGGGFCIMTITFNLDRSVFKDVRVRQAIAYAIDRQQIVDQIIFGQGRVAEAPISSAITWAHLSGGPQYAYNPAMAEQLLDAAGFPKGADGTRFKIDFVHFPEYSKYGELLRQQLGKVGIELTPRPLDRTAALDTIFNKRDFDTNVISYCNNSDPTIGVSRMYVSTNIGNIPFSNGADYKNPQIDTLFNQAATTSDQAKRGDLYHQIQQILLTDLPYWWLVETNSSIGARSNCHDFQVWTGHFAEKAYCAA